MLLLQIIIISITLLRSHLHVIPNYTHLHIPIITIASIKTHSSLLFMAQSHLFEWRGLYLPSVQRPNFSSDLSPLSTPASFSSIPSPVSCVWFSQCLLHVSKVSSNPVFHLSLLHRSINIPVRIYNPFTSSIYYSPTSSLPAQVLSK